MVISFFLVYFLSKNKIPVGLNLLIASISCALVAGEGIPILHIIEGAFTFFDIVAIIITASLFIAIQKESGSINIIVHDLIKGFSLFTPLLLVLLMFVIILPGALAGSGTAAVMAVGGLVGTILKQIGLPKTNVTAFVAIGGVLGLAAPPINIPAMIIAAGINMPYMGFFFPLLILTVPLGIVFPLLLGSKYVELQIEPEPILNKIPLTPVKLGRIGAYLPLLLVIGLFIFQRVFPGILPYLGVPLVFVIGTIVAILISVNINIIEITRKCFHEILPVSTVLIAVGSTVQIMALTGVSGFFVISAITAPLFIVYIALAIGLPLSGGVLGTFGSSAAFGIPFMLALIGTRPILETTGIALICSISTLCPPSAIVGNASIFVTNYNGKFVDLLKLYLIPIVVICGLGLYVIIFSNKLNWMLL